MARCDYCETETADWADDGFVSCAVCGMLKLFPEGLRPAPGELPAQREDKPKPVLHIPVFAPPGGDAPRSKADDNEDLRRLAREGLAARFAGEVPREYSARLERELEVITGGGAAFMLLEAKCNTDLLRARGLPIHPGRGSVCASLVSHALRITHLDPIAHDLPFERFMTKGGLASGKMPDIDMDVGGEEARELLLADVRSRYGDSHVYGIHTVIRMGIKKAITEAGRQMQVDTTALRKKTYKDQWPNPANHAEREVVTAAKGMHGKEFASGTHPAGCVVLPRTAKEMGLPTAPGTRGLNLSMTVKEVDKAGLVKLDFLGSRNLLIAHEAAQAITGGEPREAMDWLQHIDIEDPAAYEMLNRKGGAHCIFQAQGEATLELIPRLRPKSFRDFVLLNALGRPGLNTMRDELLLRRSGRKPVRAPHDSLEELTSKTYGILVFQEQLEQALRILADFEDDEAGAMVKGLSKKTPEVVRHYRPLFAEGFKRKHGATEQDVTTLWALYIQGTEYIFSAAHSSAYTVLSVWQLKLKSMDAKTYIEVWEKHKDKKAEREEANRARRAEGLSQVDHLQVRKQARAAAKKAACNQMELV